MDLDISLADAEKVLGKSTKVERTDGYDRHYYGDNFYIAVNGGKVDAFVTYDPKYKTLRGLHVGSTYKEVVDAYGSNSKDMESDGLALHEYPFNSLEGKPGLLRFAIDNSGRVDYISIRIVEEPKPKEEPKSNIDKNTEQAARVFVSYHKAITSGDFATAYSLMDSNQQARLGPSLRDFAQGYRTTISSEVTDLNLVSTSDNFIVMKYVLDSRDRDNGSVLYQQFAGEVQMTKVDGEWKIHYTESKKIKAVRER